MTRQTAIQAQQQTPTTHPLSRGGILQRKCESCGQHTIAGGNCSTCQKPEGILQQSSNNLVEFSELKFNENVRGTNTNYGKSQFGRDFIQVRSHTKVPK